CTNTIYVTHHSFIFFSLLSKAIPSFFLHGLWSSSSTFLFFFATFTSTKPYPSPSSIMFFFYPRHQTFILLHCFSSNTCTPTHQTSLSLLSFS
ncbi:hypothetical protein VIGAN_04259000, partial [Vigna angularis var. angularis]